MADDLTHSVLSVIIAICPNITSSSNIKPSLARRSVTSIETAIMFYVDAPDKIRDPRWCVLLPPASESLTLQAPHETADLSPVQYLLCSPLTKGIRPSGLHVVALYLHHPWKTPDHALLLSVVPVYKCVCRMVRGKAVVYSHLDEIHLLTTIYLSQ